MYIGAHNSLPLSGIPYELIRSQGMYMNRSNLGFAAAAAAPLIAASGPAAPFMAIALAIAPLFVKLGMDKIGKGCGQSCILTSNAANEIEQILITNLRTFERGTKTAEEQRAALAIFDETWARLVEYCSQPGFQTTKAGRNCVEDRREGACKWKEGGQCWNWFIGYRDPIANAVLGSGSRDTVTGASPATGGDTRGGGAGH